MPISTERLKELLHVYRESMLACSAWLATERATGGDRVKEAERTLLYWHDRVWETQETLKRRKNRED